MSNELKIGLIGGGWMGKAHTVAYKNVPLIFGNKPSIPVLHTVADINIKFAEETYKYGGFKYFTNDWKKVVDWKH